MADSKISDLAAAASIDSGDLIPIVQGGVNKKLDFDNLVSSTPLSIYMKAALIGGLKGYGR